MKYRLHLGLLTLATVACVGTYMFQDNVMQYQPRTEQGAAKSIRGAQEYLRMLRANVVTGEVEPEDARLMAKAVANYSANQSKALGVQWSEMGPDNVGGRVRSVVIDPNNPQTIWTGGVSGGLWRTTNGGNNWEQITSFSEHLCISSIAILGNGQIIVATGSTFEGPNGTGGSGFVGGGLFRSTDGGASFELIQAPAAPWSVSASWAIIDEVLPHPTDPNRCWVAYNKGLKLYDSGANVMEAPWGADLPQVLCKALEVSSDGQTILLDMGTNTYISRNGGNNFDPIPTSSGYPSGSAYSRVEYAISPDNNNYMYAIMCSGSGSMYGVFASTDHGFTWTRIWPQGFGGNGVPELDLFGDNSQGNYDMAIRVVPGDPTTIWVGGVTLWQVGLNSPPLQIALGFDFVGCFTCVHADVHEITFGPDGTAYIGCDGGIYISPAGLQGQVYYAANRSLNITQFYSIAHSAKGRVIGGTQDNGTQYLPGQGGTTPYEAIEVTGGDGFDTEISQIDGNIMFSTIYFGALLRSADQGQNFSSFYDSRITALGIPGDLQNGLGDFYTDIALYENWNDTGSLDSITYTNNLSDTLLAGETLNYVGRMPQVGQSIVLTQDLLPDSSIRLQDKVQSLLAVGFSGAEGIWVTRDATQFIDGVVWSKVVNSANGTVNCLEWSEDGNHLFWGTTGGDVFRISNFNAAYDSSTMDITGSNYQLDGPHTILSGSGVITSLHSDPNPGMGARLMITAGGYGGSNKVRIVENVFTPTPAGSVWNVPTELSGMPVYSGLIHATNPNIFIVGTEFGIMASEDGGDNWSFENNGIPKVPVFALRQQTWNWENNPYGPGYVTNPYVIYAGTHGRGAFKSETFLGVAPPDFANHSSDNGLSVTVFPNPATEFATVEFTVSSKEEVNITLYDMNGKVVQRDRPSSYGPGTHRVRMTLGDIPPSTYLVEVRSGTQRKMGRFVVSR